MKSLIVFDLDGTLAQSKARIDSEMATLLAGLVALVKVAIISGGAWPQFESQLLTELQPDTKLDNLSLLPTCGTRFLRYENGWKTLYEENLTELQKQKIESALNDAAAAAGLQAAQTWGDVIEDRQSQITFSGLGQEAPLAEKSKWDPDFAKRKQMKQTLDKLLPDFSVRLGGSTSIDVTLPGIDKAYGITKLREIVGTPNAEMLYVGDALFPGGNDYPVRGTGVSCIQVADPGQTKRVIETSIAFL